MSKSDEDCAACGATPGENHGDHCDWARCPDCGDQLLMHWCDHWSDGVDTPDRPAVWHGVDPRDEVARTLNWWTTAVGIDHLVEDTTRVLVASALGQITWDRDNQRYVIGAIDETEIDRSLTR
jgi:hypothetical protein